MGLIKQNMDFEIILLNVNYGYVGFDKDSLEDSEMVVLDDYKMDGFNEDLVSISLTRKVHYEPEMIFNISVTLQIVYNINKDSKQKLTKDNLVKELESKKKILLSPLVSKAVLLIANITNADDDFNVITLPFLLKTEEKHN